MMVHFHGALRPGAKAVPTDVKNDIYFPPDFMLKVPTARTAFLRIAQTFTEDIAVPAAVRWKEAFAAAGYRVSTPSKGGKKPANASAPANPLHPHPLPRTTLYLVYGLPHGELEQLLTQEQAEQDEAPREDASALAAQMQAMADAYQERIASLESQIQGLRDDVAAQAEEIARLHRTKSGSAGTSLCICTTAAC